MPIEDPPRALTRVTDRRNSVSTMGVGRIWPGAVVGAILSVAALGLMPTPVLASDTAAPEGASCEGLADRSPGTSTGTLVHGGRARSYELHVPVGYDATTSTPLLVSLHGQGSYGLQQILYSDVRALADREGFLVVAPDVAYPDTDQWHTGAALGDIPADTTVDDLGFVGRLLNSLEANLCVDSDRVFATGISSGAFMASALACRMPNRIAAVAAVAGSLFFDDPAVCRSSRAVPVLAFHGSADRNVPFPAQTFQRSGPRDSVVNHLRRWALGRNGCTESTTVATLAPDVSLRQWTCPPSGATKLVRIQGGGHTWPGSPFEVPSLGPTTQNVSATDMAWRFFTRHPRA